MTVTHRPVILWWLYLCAALVFTMVILGGSVRLTGSGLSMVDWQPLLGILPPMNLAEWQAAFDSYRNYPEYQLINRGMSLEEFKFIFYMEYFHRLLGRLVGIVFALPFFYWLIRGALPDWMKPRLWIALLLGGAQGLLGWYMVKSGLVDNPHVSQYRLTSHLLLAIFIFAWLLVLAFRLQWQDQVMPLFNQVLDTMRFRGSAVIVLVFAMMGTGGFMAGTKAGFIHNTWPTMSGEWVPDQVWVMTPWWRNLFDNPMGIQFVHRWLAVVVMVAVLAYGVSVIRRAADGFTRLLGALLMLMVLVQVGLGIATLVGRVPVGLGVIHQGGALVLLGLLLAAWTRFRRGGDT